MDLIAITQHAFGPELLPTVNGRDLHGFLEARRDFSNWMKDRIQQYGFEADRDYLLAKFGEQLKSGTKYRIDYYLTLDMAKELSMVERNAKGREARRYFIECERRLKAELAQPVEDEAKQTPSLMADEEELRAIHKVRLADSIFGKNAARALWFKVGLPTVPEMLGENVTFREEHDAVAIFAREGLERVSGYYTPAAKMYPAFVEFCQARDLTISEKQSFLTRLGKMGLPKRKMMGRSVYVGLRPVLLN